MAQYWLDLKRERRLRTRLDVADLWAELGYADPDDWRPACSVAPRALTGYSLWVQCSQCLTWRRISG